MSQHRIMPSKLAILHYWHKKLWDMPESEHEARKTWIKTCWACGFPAAKIERCHILARGDGGKDTVDNLVLLCNYCHLIQEQECVTNEGRQKFVEDLIDGAPYMSVRMQALQTAYERMPEQKKASIESIAKKLYNINNGKP